MDETWHEAHHCQENIYPEVQAESHFEKNTKGWDQQRKYDADDIGHESRFLPKGRYVWRMIISPNDTGKNALGCTP